MCLATLVVFASERVRDAEQALSTGEFMRGLGLAAAVVAIVALVLIEFVYRNRFRRATYHWLLFLGLFVLPGITLMSMATMVSEETKKVDACATCHVMDPFINDMRDPFSATLAARHYKNRWVPDHQCYMCHTTYGAHGTLAAKRDGFRHWLLYVTATWEEPIQYSGSYPNSNCLTCHEGTSKFDRGKSHRALAKDLVRDRVSCSTCHGPPHPVPGERLSTARYP